MNLSEISIRRPVFTTLLAVTFVVLGLFGYKQLAISSLPKVDFPTIVIEADLPGADPETVAATVAGPIEDQLAAIAGVTSLTSWAIQGKTVITVTFELGRDIDAAALDVQAALSVAQKRLPTEMPSPPWFSKNNPAEKALLYVSVSSPLLLLSDVYDYADNVVKRQVAHVPGVGRVKVHGMSKFAVRVQVDHEAAAARGISFDELRDVIAKANSGTPTGMLSGDRQNIPLTPSGQMGRAEEYGNLIVAWRHGGPIRLKDVARVVDSVEWLNSVSWHGPERAVNISIYRQPDANAIEVATAVRAVIDRLLPNAPNSISIQPLTDRSIPIREAARDVQMSLLIAIGLVILVIALFLGSLRATIIPAVTLPISIIGTCAFMYVFGLSLNNITLLAATLAVGFVVDDAIVMLENISRYIEEGLQPFEAAIKGAREITFTILSISVSLIAVFIPIFFMGGVVGRVFREFAITMSVAIVISAVVSLTLVPMLCAYGLRPHSETAKNLVLRAFDRAFRLWLNAYEWTLGWCIRLRAVTLAVTFLTLAGTAWLVAIIPMGFFPDEDNGILWIKTEVPTDASHDYLRARHLQVEQIVRADPAVEDTVHHVHMTEDNNISVKLKPRGERDPMQVIVKRLREAVSVVPGIRVSITPLQVMSFSAGSAAYEFNLRAERISDLQNVVPGLFETLSKLPVLTDVSTDLKLAPKVDLLIDREKAAVYGISNDRIRQELFDAFGMRVISTIQTQSNGYAVILEALPEFQTHAAHLSRVRIKTASGQVIPLDAVVRVVPSAGPVKVMHNGQRPSASIFFNPAPGVPLSRAIEEIRKVEKEANIPPTVTTGFQGGAKLFEEAMQGQWLLVLAAIFATYVILGILYESFIHPITIIAGLPSAGIGALITLILLKTELSVIAMIGIIMLIGIVKKNAIMMIDFALERRLAGVSAEAAIVEACLLRFRPIMMTTFAAIFGALPIALGQGAGAELRQPLGIAVVGGLIVSQLLTLYITPVVYLYLDRFDSKLKRALARPALAATVEPESHQQRPQLIAAE